MNMPASHDDKQFITFKTNTMKTDAKLQLKMILASNLRRLCSFFCIILKNDDFFCCFDRQLRFYGQFDGLKLWRCGEI